METTVNCEGRVSYTTRIRGWHHFHTCYNKSVVTGPDGKHWCPAHAKQNKVPYTSPNQKYSFKVHYRVVKGIEGSVRPGEQTGHESASYIEGKNEKGASMSFKRTFSKWYPNLTLEITNIEKF